MKVVLGIGNPGNRYTYNRHNAGFLFLDYLAQSYSLSFKASKYDCVLAEGKLGDINFLLVKPSTYVNNSGITASQLITTLGLTVSDLLVIHDDINLGKAEFRIKPSGSDGGHNGLTSIIYHLNSNEFPRIRIGVGADFEKGRMAEYVLSDFSQDEFSQMESVFKACKSLTEEFISGGIKQLLDANSKLRSTDIPPDNKIEL